MNWETAVAVVIVVLALIAVIRAARRPRTHATARQIPATRPAVKNAGRAETLAEFNRRMYGDRPDAYKPGAAYVIAAYKAQRQPVFRRG